MQCLLIQIRNYDINVCTFIRFIVFKNGDPINEISHNFNDLAKKYLVGSIKSSHYVNCHLLTFKATIKILMICFQLEIFSSTLETLDN